MHLRLGVLVMMAGGLNACRPGDILSVPAPTGVQSNAALKSQTGAEAAYSGAKGKLFQIAAGDFGLYQWSGLLSDEFSFSGFSNYGEYANVDARMAETSGGFVEPTDGTWQGLLTARSSMLLAVPLLAQYEPSSGRSLIGETYALVGYAELLLAESFCAGTTLDQVVSGGGIQYGMPLSTDSLLGVAAAHFDSAIAEANGNDTVTNMAHVGLARALLNRGQYAAAATAAQAVPNGFVYEIELQPSYNSNPYSPSLYSYGYDFVYGRIFNVADREGGNGLDFVSAHDPRLTLDSSLQTLDATARWYLPLKFEANLSYIPLATGAEARLIAAEAALKAGLTSGWLTDLNALRNSGCSVSGADTTCSLGTGQVPSQMAGLPSLQDPGTDSGRVSLMFRERAFWLFGTGTRLGDLRRLMRQYGRDQAAVFPTGTYASGNNSNLPTPIPKYGTDVSFTLPTPAGLAQASSTISNPNYKGCLSSPAIP